MSLCARFLLLLAPIKFPQTLKQTSGSSAARCSARLFPCPSVVCCLAGRAGSDHQSFFTGSGLLFYVWLFRRRRTVWPLFSLFNQAKDTNWAGRFRRLSEEISEALRLCHGSIPRSLSLSLVHLLSSEAVCQPAESSSDSLFKLDSDTNYPAELSQTGNAHKRPSAALSHHLWLLSHFLSASLWISLPLSSSFCLYHLHSVLQSVRKM